MARPYRNPYTVLGLERSASAEEIRQAYFALVRTHPPERDPDTFKQIRAAYERLRDPERRLEADMLLLRPWPVPDRPRRAPRLDTAVHREDVLAAARALTDLARQDWQEHFHKVRL